MKNASIIVLVVAISTTAALVTRLLSSRHRSTSAMETSLTLIGQLAPDFALEAVDGRTVHLSDFHGKAVILHFWATSWLPCRVEMQWFEMMHKQYGPQGLQMLSIAMNNADKKDIAEIASNLGIDYPILLGNEHVRDSYKVRVLPATVYVGRDGKIIEKVPGEKEHDEIEAEVKKALSHRWWTL